VGIKQKVFLAGIRDREPLLMSFDAKGRPGWEHALPLGSGPFQLLTTLRGIVVSDRSGAACLVSTTGKTVWVLGSSGQPLRRGLSARLARTILIVPGEQVRAVELASGRLLGEIDAGAGLLDLAIDSKLNLYLLEESGRLRAYRLASHLAVVER